MCSVTVSPVSGKVHFGKHGSQMGDKTSEKESAAGRDVHTYMK